MKEFGLEVNGLVAVILGEPVDMIQCLRKIKNERYNFFANESALPKIID